MRETSERRNRQTRNTQDATSGDDGRKRKAFDERYEAVRRWIGADEDGCCRGID